MTTSKRSLLLAAACCAVLAGCPRVAAVTGLVKGAPGDVLVAGERMMDGEQFTVTPGSSISIEYDNGCVETYGEGVHAANEVDCDEDEDDQDDDRDQDDEQDSETEQEQEPEQEQEQEQSEQQEQQEQPRDRATDSQSTGNTTTTQATAPRPGVLDTVTSAVTSTTGMIVTGAVVGGLLYEHIEDNRDDDKEPVSP